MSAATTPTANAAIGRDLSRIFNFVTGYAEPADLEVLAASPKGIRNRILDHLQRVALCVREVQGREHAPLLHPCEECGDRILLLPLLDLLLCALALGVEHRVRA